MKLFEVNEILLKSIYEDKEFRDYAERENEELNITHREHI